MQPMIQWSTLLGFTYPDLKALAKQAAREGNVALADEIELVWLHQTIVPHAENPDMCQACWTGAHPFKLWRGYGASPLVEWGFMGMTGPSVVTDIDGRIVEERI